MFSKRNKYIFALSFILFVTSFAIGYFVMDRNIKNETNQLTAHENNQEEVGPDIEIIREENRITPNTFIETRIHYKECGHLESNATLASEEYVNLTKDELIEYLYANSPELRLISFSNVKVVLWGERNHLCKDHFIIGEENGKIAIFKIGENGEKILDKVFVEYPINVLLDLDQQKLKEGIVVNSQDELSDILEDYIS
jgi:hypothetical protein